MGGVDIAHRDRRPERGAEAAAGDLADRVAGVIDDRRRLARRSAAVGADADAPARRTFGELAQDDAGAGKAAFRAPALADGPGELGLDRGRGLVDVVAVEAQPGFEAQRIARAEADRHHLRLGQQPLGQSRRVGRRQRNLEPVLAGIARAGDEASAPVERQFGARS